MGVNREDLFKEVWAEPMTTIAKRYKVSSSFLARVCKRMNVPRPPRGYWAKLKVGRTTPQPQLPDARPGDELEWLRSGERERVSEVLPKPPMDVGKKRRRRKRDRPSCHRLLVDIQEYFDNAKVSELGYLRPKKRKLVDVFVTKETLARALDVANEIFLALEDSGYEVTLTYRLFRPDVDERIESGQKRYSFETWSPSHPTIVYLGTVPIGLTIFELSEEIKVVSWRNKYVPISGITEKDRLKMKREYTWETTRDRPTGRLCLRATSPYYHTPWEQQWRESKPGTLQKKIPSIIRCLREASPGIAEGVEAAHREAEIRQKEWEEQQRQWKREREEARRVKAYNDSREQLLGLIEKWSLACRIEGFFESLVRREQDIDQQDREAFRVRFDRAREMFGGTDALRFFDTWKSPEER